MQTQPAAELAAWQDRLFSKVLSPEEAAADATTAGFGVRNRKLTAPRFLVTLVFGWGVEEQRTLASLRRFFTAATGIAVVSSAFQTRFTPAAVVFLKIVYERLLAKADSVKSGLPMALRRFKDVLAIDGSVITLRDKLARHFRACRTNHSQAALKLHAVMSLHDNTVVELATKSERFSERRFLNQFVPKFAGSLLLFDLGYFKHQFFERLAKVGAFFVSRLKDSSNPTLVEIHRGIRATKAAVGSRLDDNEFVGPVVEALVTLGTGGTTVFRIVGLRFPGTTEYRFYLTNLLSAEFTAEEIFDIYTKRWQIELLFKELKSLCRIDQIPTTKPNTVLCLVYASLIAILVSRLFAAAVEQTKTTTKIIRRTVVTKCLGHYSRELAAGFLAGGELLRRVVSQFVSLLESASPDPNIKRRPNRIGVATY